MEYSPINLGKESLTLPGKESLCKTLLLLCDMKMKAHPYVLTDYEPVYFFHKNYLKKKKNVFHFFRTQIVQCPLSEYLN